jgi:replicative DNA helicase
LPSRIEEPRNGDRIVALQRKIDDGRISARLPSTEGREFQSRLDSIRRDYLQMTEGGRSTTYEERADISRRLDSLETELNRFR